MPNYYEDIPWEGNWESYEEEEEEEFYPSDEIPWEGQWEPTGPMRISDIPKSIATGVGTALKTLRPIMALQDMPYLAGKGLQAIGAITGREEDLGALGEFLTEASRTEQTRKIAEETEKYWEESLSPRAKELKKKPFLGPEGVTAAEAVPKIAMMAAESIPMTFLGMGGGMVIARSLISAGMSPGVAGMIGGAIGEGVTAGISNADQIYEDLIARNPEDLAEMPIYQEIYDALPDNLDEAGKKKLARKIMALAGSAFVGLTTTVSTGILGAPSGYVMGKIIGGESKNFLRNIIQEALSEGLIEEAPQSAVETIMSNVATKYLADPEQGITEGALEAAIGGGFTGALMGGGMAIPGTIAGRAPDQITRQILDDYHEGRLTFGELKEIHDAIPPDHPTALAINKIITGLTASTETQDLLPGTTKERPEVDLVDLTALAEAPPPVPAAPEVPAPPTYPTGYPSVRIGEEEPLLDMWERLSAQQAEARRVPTPAEESARVFEQYYEGEDLLDTWQRLSEQTAAERAATEEELAYRAAETPAAAEGLREQLAAEERGEEYAGRIREDEGQILPGEGIGLGEAAPEGQYVEEEEGGLVRPGAGEGRPDLELEEPGQPGRPGEAITIEDIEGAAEAGPSEITAELEGQEIETEPTEAQAEAGNYKKGHVTWQGLDITIENPKGSTRTGKDEDGKAWERELKSHYGYIRRTEAKDGDQVDVFVGEQTDSDKVFIVNQAKADGSFDEHKVMVGFMTEPMARAGYLANYEPGWDRILSIQEMTIDQFKGWLEAADFTKPAGPPAAVAPKAAPTPEGLEGVTISRKIMTDTGEEMTVKMDAKEAYDEITADIDKWNTLLECLGM